MADTIKKLVVEVVASTGNAQKKIDDFAKATKSVSSGAKGMSAGLDIASVAVGSFVGQLASNVVLAFGEAISKVVSTVIDLGTQTQKTIATLSAMKNNLTDAREAYQAFNDVGRNTNFDLDAVQQMGVQLLNMGYSAQNAADLIQLCADAAAGLGQGQQGAQTLVDTISRIQATGEMSSRQLITLAQAGMDLDKAFSTVGMSAAEAMNAMENGTMDAQTAVKALTTYMHEFDGSMAESKKNITDMWGDVAGNVQTALGEIGASIFEAFSQSEIVQTLIDATQDLVDFVRSDGVGAFEDLGDIASVVLEAVNDLLKVVIGTLKVIVVTVSNVYAAFREFGSQVYSAVRPAIDALMAVYNVVKNILSAVGAGVADYVNTAWSSATDSGLDPEERAERARAARQNNFRNATRRKLPTGGGGGGGGGASKAISDEERQVNALIEKYTDAKKARENSVKGAIELAKVNMSMMVGEAKEIEGRRIALESLDTAHKELMLGYKDELAIAERISDASVRNKVIDNIKAQIDAEEKLYEAKVKSANYDFDVRQNQKDTKSILDLAFGTDDEIERKIKYAKESIERIFDIADHFGDNQAYSQEDMGFIANLLGKTPEALQEELDAKGESITQFIERNKETMAEATKAYVDQQSAVKNWADLTISYAMQVGDAMSNAMMDFITGAKSGKQALSDFVSSMLKNAAQLLTRWLSLFAIFSIVGDPQLAARNASAAVFGTNGGTIQLRKSPVGGGGIGANASGIFGVSTGGFISGEGTSTSDSIPAMLSNGEYVIRAAAVKKVGVPTLSQINRGHFASGGLVGGREKDAKPMNRIGNLTLQVNALDATDFDGFLMRGGGEKIQNMLVEAERRFAFNMG